MDEAHLWAALENLSQRVAALEQAEVENRIRRAVQDSWMRAGVFIGPMISALIIGVVLRLL